MNINADDSISASVLESRLVTSENVFGTILEHVCAGIVIFDRRGQCLFANKWIINILGYDESEIVGRSSIDLVHPEDTDHVTRVIWRMARSRKSSSTRARLLRKSGDAVDVKVTIELVKGILDDEPAFLATVNPTSCKGSVIQGQAMPAKIYRTIFKHSPCLAAFSRLSDAELLDASDSFFEHTGYTFEELTGQSVEQVDLFPDKEELKNYVDTIFSTGRVRNYEMRMQFKSGEIHPMLMFADIVRIGSDEFVVASALDISELREAEQQTQKALSALEKAFELQSEFLNVVTHEVRTPLTSVLGYARMLMEGTAGPINREQMRLLNNVVASTDSLLRLVDSALEITRIRRGKAVLTTAVCNPLEIVQKVVEEIMPECSKQNNEINIIPRQTPHSGLYDSQKLGIAVSNLISNSVKFTKNGRIDVFVEQTSDGAEIVVCDTGCGIPGDRLIDIFDEFIQLDSASKHKSAGFGLGLSIVLSMVQIMGATLVVSSEQGLGTAVTLTLPELTAV